MEGRGREQKNEAGGGKVNGPGGGGRSRKLEMKNGRRGRKRGREEGGGSTMLLCSGGSDSTHLGRKLGAQGWLEALGSGIFIFSLPPPQWFFFLA